MTARHAKGWDSIPYYKFGEAPDGMPTVDYHLTVLKRALIDGYDAGKDDIIAVLLTDMLADLRHMCDVLELDFGVLDKAAYEIYINERQEKGGEC